MGIEHGKKENRSEYGFYLTMKEFLDVRVDCSNVCTNYTRSVSLVIILS